ncbi:hypothetical protein C1646_766614 [Rhizophagus diaphanus]|nr:hypothetical protein C1646_766614 [Rhizophagus diaphanus] [Rhizophagus sp. MUCL 43196]
MNIQPTLKEYSDNNAYDTGLITTISPNGAIPENLDTLKINQRLYVAARNISSWVLTSANIFEELPLLRIGPVTQPEENLKSLEFK